MSTTPETQAALVAPEAPSEAPQTKSRSPLRMIRSGGLSVSIWLNETKRGAMFTVSLSRSYRAGDAWKRTSSFREEDLPGLTKAIEEAHSFIRTQRQ